MEKEREFLIENTNESGGTPDMYKDCKSFTGTNTAELILNNSQKIIKTVKLYPDVEIPVFSTPGSAGADIKAYLPEELRESGVTLKFGERYLFKTGLKVEIPFGMEIQVRPRSGNAIKFGLTVLNTPGTIDHDYRGEVGVILINLGDTYTINHGDKIAQLVQAYVPTHPYVEVEVIDENTERASGGFGHTGK